MDSPEGSLDAVCVGPHGTSNPVTMSGTKRTPAVEEKDSRELLFPEDDHAATLELLAKQALAVELGVAALPGGHT